MLNAALYQKLLLLFRQSRLIAVPIPTASTRPGPTDRACASAIDVNVCALNAKAHLVPVVLAIALVGPIAALRRMHVRRRHYATANLYSQRSMF